MSVEVEEVTGEEALAEWLSFGDEVYASRSARWPVIAPLRLPVLMGEGPSGEGRTAKVFRAREGGKTVSEAAAIVDQHYIDHWQETLGNISFFEALPGSFEATKALMDEACGWLRGQGLTAARAGNGPGNEFGGFVIDEYEALPPISVRQNPAYYHRLLKQAGFETERGWVDYSMEVTPELVGRWEEMLEAARRGGYDVLSLTEAPAGRVEDFVATWNDAFRTHWGFAPMTTGEFEELLESVGPLGMSDVSVIAYLNAEPVGIALGIPELSFLASVSEGRQLSGAERLNTFGLGVRESARGRGVNLAMAAYSYLELVKRGATHVSYTMVLDDNWPSRRTAEKLGARVRANYVVYRRELGGRPRS
jgi:hypothetical protein